MDTSATPLMSLDAVALDTETTGLDARTARIIEIAVLRIRGLKVSYDGTLRQFINPQCAIPESASQVHGLTSKDLRGAPEFRHIVAALEGRIGDAVVIGHNIGYDLAVIDREYARAGLTWKIPRFLDVRALARLADPHLAGYGLRALCDWLGVSIIERHRAFPDALAAAEVFLRLVPRLRACGIRTLAEAESASRDLPGESGLYGLGGWISPAQTIGADTARAIAAVDSYPYRHRVRDVDFHPPVFVDPTSDVREVAMRLADPSSGGLAIIKSNRGKAHFVTAADLLEAATASNGAASSLRDVRSHPLTTIADDDFLYRALGRMARLSIPHLGVVKRNGEIVGTMSADDLLRHRVTSALMLGDEIEAARTVSDLGHAWARLPEVVATSLREGVEPIDIAAIIGAEIRTLTAKAAGLAVNRMIVGGKGVPPCRYAVFVLGSAGRGDSLLSADQDNALVYEAGEPGGKEDVWFAEAGAHVADILHEVGIPYCEGGVMAKNSGCRHSLENWKKVVDGWVERPGPKEALASDIFFDAVPVYGELALTADLMAYSYARAESSPAFVAALARFAKDWQPPFGIFGRLLTDPDGRVDLKQNGLLPIVTAARTLALKHGIRPTSTVTRLTELKVRSLADADMINKAISAFTDIVRAVLTQQVKDSDHGISLSARVDVAAMGADEKEGVTKSMRAINELIKATLQT